jgi:putative membrane protein
MWDGLHLLVGSLRLRPYVFGFLVVYLGVAAAEWGWRRALLFTGLAGGLAFVAEWTSTRIGVPFGMYHYTGATLGREVYLGNVPLFDPLSFTFLAYASLGTARTCLGGRGGPWGLVVATGLLMTWLDVVIDPLAVRGERWFLGRIFYYPEPGRYFGVPMANFAGWALLGGLIAALWLFVIGPRLGGPGRRPAPWLGERHRHAVALYYLVLAFNLVLTAWVGEPVLLGAGVLVHLPLLAVVSCALSGRLPGQGDP